MKNKNTMLYYFLIVLAVLLFIFSIFVLNNTKFVAPVAIALSVYLFLGAIIKLCKRNEKLRNSILCALDLLFWIP